MHFAYKCISFESFKAKQVVQSAMVKSEMRPWDEICHVRRAFTMFSKNLQRQQVKAVWQEEYGSVKSFPRILPDFF